MCIFVRLDSHSHRLAMEGYWLQDAVHYARLAEREVATNVGRRREGGAADANFADEGRRKGQRCGRGREIGAASIVCSIDGDLRGRGW